LNILTWDLSWLQINQQRLKQMLDSTLRKDLTKLKKNEASLTKVVAMQRPNNPDKPCDVSLQTTRRFPLSF